MDRHRGDIVSTYAPTHEEEQRNPHPYLRSNRSHGSDSYCVG